MTTQEMETKAREYRELKRLQDELTAELDALADALKAAVGDSEQVIAGEYKITWKPAQTARLDTTALKKALPDIAERFTKTTISRRFQIL